MELDLPKSINPDLSALISEVNECPSCHAELRDKEQFSCSCGFNLSKYKSNITEIKISENILVYKTPKVIRGYIRAQYREKREMEMALGCGAFILGCVLLLIPIIGWLILIIAWFSASTKIPLLPIWLKMALDKKSGKNDYLKAFNSAKKSVFFGKAICPCCKNTLVEKSHEWIAYERFKAIDCHHCGKQIFPINKYIVYIESPDDLPGRSIRDLPKTLKKVIDFGETSNAIENMTLEEWIDSTKRHSLTKQYISKEHSSIDEKANELEHHLEEKTKDRMTNQKIEFACVEQLISQLSEFKFMILFGRITGNKNPREAVKLFFGFIFLVLYIALLPYFYDS